MQCFNRTTVTMYRAAPFLASLALAQFLVSAHGAATAGYLYQLQGATYAKIQGTPYQYYVVDPDDTQLTAAQLTTLKGMGKTILAYISIGEAETYRDYWQRGWKTNNPAFLEKENPDWGGNYKVRYWMPEWQTILLNFLRTHILAKGYSGVYLDIVDAYDYFQKQRPSAAQDMVNFVARIRSEARAVVPGIKIFPQNAVDLYDRTDYKVLVDGFGIEDTWMNGDDGQSSYNTNEVLRVMRQARNDGKVILSVDYPESQRNVCSFYQKCTAERFVCGAFDRDLTGIVRKCN